MDFVEICNVCVGKMIIKAAKRILSSDKICRSYSDLNFGITFLEHSVVSFFCYSGKMLECTYILRTSYDAMHEENAHKSTFILLLM